MKSSSLTTTSGQPINIKTALERVILKVKGNHKYLGEAFISYNKEITFSDCRLKIKVIGGKK